LTSVPCSDAAPCDGFYHGTALHGWAGDSEGRKAIFVEFTMPIVPKTSAFYSNSPAYWLLNAKVVRAAQFGCNCRGEGGNGGCGELDIAEVNNQYSTAGSTFYSFKASLGAGQFGRPLSPTIFAAIFNPENGGSIQLTTEVDSFTWDSTIPQSTIDTLNSKTGAVGVCFL
jgi:hypothetical protein